MTRPEPDWQTWRSTFDKRAGETTGTRRPLLSTALLVSGCLLLAACGSEKLAARPSSTVPPTASPTTSVPSPKPPSLPTVWTGRTLPAGLTAPLNDVVCPTQLDCYAVGGSPEGSSPGSIIASTDGGETWQLQYTAPTTGSEQIEFRAIACPTAAMCIAGGGTVTGAPFSASAVMTTDAGRHWSSVALPSQLGDLSGVGCVSSAVCVAVGAVYTSPAGPSILRTIDGGMSWSVVAAPPGFAFVDTVSCLSGSSCIIGGQGPGASCCSQALSSTSLDGGETWSVPVASVAGPWLQDISCIDPQTCVGVGGTNGTNTWGQGRLAVTDDGGDTWSTETSASAEAVSCTATMCLAVGATFEEATDRYPATAFISTDDGRDWRPVSPPPTQGLSSVACGTSDDCVAVGSLVTPVIVTYQSGHPSDSTGPT